MPTSVSIAIATLTWLDPTQGIATSIIIGELVAPLLAGVPSTPWEPTTNVSCPCDNPSPLSWTAKVVAPFVALSVATVAMMPTIWLACFGIWTLAVVEDP